MTPATQVRNPAHVQQALVWLYQMLPDTIAMDRFVVVGGRPLLTEAALLYAWRRGDPTLLPPAVRKRIRRDRLPNPDRFTDWNDDTVEVDHGDADHP